jgi:hypothetical protein
MENTHESLERKLNGQNGHSEREITVVSAPNAVILVEQIELSPEEKAAFTVDATISGIVDTHPAKELVAAEAR